MRFSLRVGLLLAASTWLLSCSDPAAQSPSASDGVRFTTTAPPNVRFSEIHYDNTGTDAGEAIEVSAPAGTDLTGWQVVLYNGNGGASYDAQTLSGDVPDLCTGRGVIALNYPTNGIQNGNPDGFALVNATGVIVEFLSYGGTFAAVGGPADGLTSVDIGVAESSSTAAGLSLQRDSAGTWTGPLAATFGACNGGAPPPPVGAIVIHELMAEPVNASGGASWGEWFEVHNQGTTPLDLQGWTIASAGQAEHVVGSSVIVPAGGYAVLGRGDDPARNGGIALDYNYFTGGTTIWIDDVDWLELRDTSGAAVDRVQWSAAPAPGVTRGVREPASDNTDVDGANWGYSTVIFGDGDYGTPGAPNGTLADTAPDVVAPARVTFSGRTASDPPLPVGFEDQLFATLVAGGSSVPTTWTWSSETPALASVDADGVVRALDAGTALIRATAADGTTDTYAVATRIAAASTTADYQNHSEFGEPADADPSDDIILRHAQFTTSYSATRNTPNWVAYNIDATHFGNEDRCDCFTADPSLPAGVGLITTADYTGAGAAAGFAIDRGHLVRSFDRTSASLDNAVTYYFSNIVPQAADNNQGPWSAFEIYIGDLARVQNKEVFVIAGVAGDAGTVKDEGTIVIPAEVWKVAVVLPRDGSLDDIDSYDDLEVIAVLLPNVAGIRNAPWTDFQTTVDAVEAASGYDLLALLTDHIEMLVESGTQPPSAAHDGPYAGVEGQPVAMSAAASNDPDGQALTYAWDFGDGVNASGRDVTHSYTGGGVFDVTLVVTSALGFADTATTAATIAALTHEQRIEALIEHVEVLVANGDLPHGRGVAMRVTLNAALRQVQRGRYDVARLSLSAFIKEVLLLDRLGWIPADEAAALVEEAKRARTRLP